MGHVVRRQFLLGASVLLAPWVVLAQPRIPRVGVLIPGARTSDFHESFVRGMRDLGYVDRKNIVIEVRRADGDLAKLPMLAEELVKLKLDIIVAASTPAVRAVRKASDGIPIVMVAGGDPVGAGLVASLARPGGNTTGHSILTQDTSPKLLELVRDAVPNTTHITALLNSAAYITAIVKNIHTAAANLGMRVSVAEVRNAADFEGVFAQSARQSQSAIVVPADPLFGTYANDLARLALRHKMPTAFSESRNVIAGGLLSYGASIADSFRRGAAYVDRIIKGARPSELPVEQVTLFETVVNLRTAKALGLAIPRSVLLRADRVIE